MITDDMGNFANEAWFKVDRKMPEMARGEKVGARCRKPEDLGRI